MQDNNKTAVRMYPRKDFLIFNEEDNVLSCPVSTTKTCLSYAVHYEYHYSMEMCGPL